MDVDSFRRLLKAKDSSGCGELLRRFDTVLVSFGFNVPSRFRLAMKDFNIVIAGSTALCIILPFDQPIPARDMDAYVTSEDYEPFVKWLTKSTDYVQASHWNFHPGVSDAVDPQASSSPANQHTSGLDTLYDTVTCANALKSVTTFYSGSAD
jgi:hypothetical protein